MAWVIAFHVSGEKFQPITVNYTFTRSFDAGTIQKEGRYQDQPMPYGSATIIAPKEIPNQERISYIVKTAQVLLPELIKAGATEWYVDIGRFYSNQCNESYSNEQLALLATLKCHVNYSAYRVSKKEEQELKKKYGGFERTLI